KIHDQIEQIVLPLMEERFRDFYGSLYDPYHFLSLAPEFEYTGMPDQVKATVSGGLFGWLQIRDDIASRLDPEMRSNLLRFYDMAPRGKMVEARVWPD